MGRQPLRDCVGVRKDRQTKGEETLKLTIMVLSIIALATSVTLSVGGASAATTLNETVGGGAKSIAANGFFPKSITIHSGRHDQVHQPVQ